jgi:hypothetical protein
MRQMCRIRIDMLNFDEAIIAISRAYAAAVDQHGGRSLARVATIIVNRGSFFEALESGGTCTTRNLEKATAYFRDPTNWPNGHIPDDALRALAGIGRPVQEAA